MKKFRLALLAATAIGVAAASAAIAADNNAGIEQTGSGNSALVTQSGDSNNFNNNGTTGAATQTGDDNILDITQSGDSNNIGMTLDGVDQIGDDNSLTASQQSNGNIIGTVTQTSIASPTAANSASITQRNDGASVNTNGNTVTTLTQTTNGNGANTVSVDQNGAGNKVLSITQNNSGTGATTNTIDITLTGTDNGNSGFSGGGNADSSGATSSDFIQDGTDNHITLNANGTANQFGVSQYGTNILSALGITGDDNELGVYQDSTGSAGVNDLAISAINGNLNNIGARQLGANVATITLGATSDSNLIGLLQDGTNTASITINSGDSNNFNSQQFATNDLIISATGDGNFLNTNQNQTGVTQNALTVNLRGDDNNNVGAFSGAASTVAGANALTEGFLVQDGEGNTASFNVGMSNLSSSSNLFAMEQVGDSNNVTATVEGDDNQIAVAQNGNGNSSTITQTGNGNIVGVTQ